MAALVLFDKQGGWGETWVCASPIEEVLARHGIALGQLATRPPAPRTAVRYAMREATLVYVPVQDGTLGLLCEEGEWVSLPQGRAHALDRGKGRPTGGLPGLDDFVGHLLEISGQEGAD